MTDTETLAADDMAMPTSPDAPTNTVVWFELPAENLERAVAFYSTVLKTSLSIDSTGPNPMAAFPSRDKSGVSGHIYPGKPARGAGPTVHLLVPDSLEAAIDRVFDAGGEVTPGIIPIAQGRFAYATDTEGNSIGLFERS